MFKLEELRKAQGLSRRELAEKSGGAEQSIQRLESLSDDPRTAKLLTLMQLAKALKCKVRDFFPKEKYI